MATFNIFHASTEQKWKAGFDLSSHTLKTCLTNTAPVATNSVFGDLTEISAGNGYTAGGATTTISSATQTTGTFKLVVSPVVFTASGGSIGPFRYAVLYDSTPTSPYTKPLVGWLDYGSAVTLASGESFTVQYDGTSGVFTDTHS